MLQGGAKFPTGGKAREPRGMNWLDSSADSKVWMEEVESLLIKVVSIIYAGIKSKTLWNGNHSRVFIFRKIKCRGQIR